MSYVTPNSTVRFCRGIRLSPDYKNTIFFTSQAAQTNYFMNQSLSWLTKTQYSYIKNNKIRVQETIANLFNCNYLMFQNTAFNDKWFYAFITNVEYISNQVCEITYEIDQIQTWFFQFQFNKCFIERQMALAGENIGDNIVPDDLYLGEYVVVNDLSIQDDNMNPFLIVVAATFDSSYNDASGGTWNGGVYSALQYHSFHDPTSASNFINGAVSAGKESGIISVFQMAEYFFNNTSSFEPGSRDISIGSAAGSLDGGYVPNNLKLYTYPYTFLLATNNNGTAAAWRFEDFGTGGKVTCIGDTSPNPSIYMVPRSYKGKDYNFDEKVAISGYPQCAWASDAYQAWLAQTSAGIEYQYGNIALNAGIRGLSTGNILGAILGGAASAGSMTMDLMAQGEKTDLLPPQAHGTTGSYPGLEFDSMRPTLLKVSLKKEALERIDSYWNMYGYPVRKVAAINFNSRPHWNYVKTVGADVAGNAPQIAIDTIKNVLNRGITFWKNGGEIGDYSLSNLA